jgi:hypothetical protein
MAPPEPGKLAFRFVLIIGITNLFADMIYEGLRGISGPFLGSLAASAPVVGFVADGGALLGYALRSVSGYFADKTHKYWPVILAGYFINVLTVPALALALHNLLLRCRTNTLLDCFSSATQPNNSSRRRVYCRRWDYHFGEPLKSKVHRPDL